jgi:hypothetical protein
LVAGQDREGPSEVAGRLIRTLEDGVLEPGQRAAGWDGRATDGSIVASGIYFYTFRAGDFHATRKLVHTR